MKRTRTISFITFILFVFTSVCFGIGYSSYANKNFNYEIIIPDSWKKEEMTNAEKHYMHASKDTDTEIKVRAFKSNDDIDKTIHDKTWNLKKIDPGLNKIIETKKIKIKKNITGKLLIFEYNSQKRFLQRALITNNNGIIYIIECRSPQNIFYKYEDIFNTALASFKYIQGGGEVLPEPDENIKTDNKIEDEELEEVIPGSIGEDEEI